MYNNMDERYISMVSEKIVCFQDKEFREEIFKMVEKEKISENNQIAVSFSLYETKDEVTHEQYKKMKKELKKLINKQTRSSFKNTHISLEIKQKQKRLKKIEDSLGI